MLIVKDSFKKICISFLLLSTYCYLGILRISRVIADVYRCTKWLSTSYNKDISVARSGILPCSIDIVTYYCYLWNLRKASIVAQVYWCTKARTVIVTHCKKDITLPEMVSSHVT